MDYSVAVAMLIGGMCVMAVFLLPIFVAFKRGHMNRWPIVVLALVGLLFWPAWAAALMWSMCMGVEA